MLPSANTQKYCSIAEIMLDRIRFLALFCRAIGEDWLNKFYILLTCQRLTIKD
jgi:hypothetical protein